MRICQGKIHPQKRLIIARVCRLGKLPCRSGRHNMFLICVRSIPALAGEAEVRKLCNWMAVVYNAGTWNSGSEGIGSIVQNVEVWRNPSSWYRI